MTGINVPVVHSSYGRLRVHLADPTGQVSAHLRAFPGVQSAEANELTGNILILFDPDQTSVQALCAELEAPGAGTHIVTLPAEAPMPSALVTETVQHIDLHAQPEYVTGLRGRIYRICGWASVGMAVVGAILPGIPTVPFVVLAGYFFVRSSPEAHAWLLRSRWFGPLLREWEEHHAIRKSVRNLALGLMGAGLIITLLIGLPLVVVVTIVALEIVGLAVVLNLPVLEEAALVPVVADA